MTRNADQPLSTVLDTVPLTEAHETLLRLNEHIELLPAADAPTLLNTLAGLLKAGHDMGLQTVLEAIYSQRVLLECATGVPRESHSRFLPDAEADTLHRHRNLLLTLVLAAVLDYNGDAREAAKHFPPLKMRTHNPAIRPYTSDEVALLRVWVLGLSKGSKDNRRAAAVCAQVDAGVRTGETTQVYADDFHLEDTCGILKAPGHFTGQGKLKTPRVQGRVISLDGFASRILASYTTQLRRTGVTGDTLLTYRPRTNHTTQDPIKRHAAALASATGIVDRVRQAVGLAHNDTTNSSLWRWRINYTATHEGFDAAATMAGCEKQQLERYLPVAHRSPRKPKKNRRDFGIQG